MPTLRSNVPTTRSGLQRGDPPPFKRKRSKADEQTRKRPKSEKDDEEGLEKGKGGWAGKKEKNKQKRGKVARYVPTILLLSLLTYSTPRKTSADKAKEEAAAKAAAKHLQ